MFSGWRGDAASRRGKVFPATERHRSAACSCAGRNRSNLVGVPIHFAQRVQYLVDGDRPLVAGRAPDGGIGLHGIGVRSPGCKDGALHLRSEEQTHETPSIMRIMYAVL